MKDLLMNFHQNMQEKVSSAKYLQSVLRQGLFVFEVSV